MTIHTRPEACLEQLSFEETLIRLYGREGKDRAHTRCLEAAEGFRLTFGYPAQALFSAPGRTEIGGNHTDHQRGCVLAASVDLDILAAAAPTQSGVIRVLSQGYPMTEVDLRELTPRQDEVNTSAALIRGVAARMSEMGCDLRGRGLDVYMTSTVPKGSGLSSSAAYEVLIGTMLNELFWAGHCTPVELAQIGQYAENVFFGKPCGLMDQTASSVGGVVAIDFADTAHPVVERLDVDLHAYGYALCILDSGRGVQRHHRGAAGGLPGVRQRGAAGGPGGGLPCVAAQGQKSGGGSGGKPGLPRLRRKPPGTGGKRGPPSGGFRPVPHPGAGIRALLRHVSAKHHPHRERYRPGADGDHRPVRAHSGGAGRRPCPRRRLRRHGAGVRAAGYAGRLPRQGGSLAGTGLLPRGAHPAGRRHPAGIGGAACAIRPLKICWATPCAQDL